MPAVILVVLWWKRDRLRWRDVWPLLPMLAVGAAMGVMTACLEVTHVGASGSRWPFSAVDRFLIAGRAVWFYAWKLFAPYKLIFIYPKWEIDSSVWWQYLPPLGVVAAFAVLWLARRPPGASHAGRLGKGPLAAALIFAGTLFPALGFLNVYPMRYSFAADHFQYLACIALIALFAGAVTKLCRRKGQARALLRFGAAGAVLAVLAVLTWQQCFVYSDRETLYRDILSKDSGSPMAHNNLGELLYRKGEYLDAAYHFRESLRRRPRSPGTLSNLGVVLAQMGNLPEALRYCRNAIDADPNHAIAQSNMAFVLAKNGQWRDAIRHAHRALQIDPSSAEAHNILATVLASRGYLAGAARHYFAAVQIAPESAELHYKLGTVLVRLGDMGGSVRHLRIAVEINHNYAEARCELAKVLESLGRWPEAVEQYRRAVELAPGRADAMNSLAWMLATSWEAPLRNAAEAVEYARRACKMTQHRNHMFVDTLAAAQAAAGDFPGAIETAKRAIRLAEQAAAGAAAAAYRKRLDLFEEGKPYVEPPRTPGASVP
jgi:Flp pilus assembly protein TadD